MKLVKVAIERPDYLRSNQTVLDYIDIPNGGLYDDHYFEEFDGDVWLVKHSTFKAMVKELDYHEINYIVISKHTIKDI